MAIDPTGTTVAVTLQENNGVALVDIASGELVTERVQRRAASP